MAPARGFRAALAYPWNSPPDNPSLRDEIIAAGLGAVAPETADLRLIKSGRAELPLD